VRYYRNLIEKQSRYLVFTKELFDTIEWIEADIVNIPSLELAFQGIEYVYHCAAMISFDQR
jgi:nucleoside-diphosphate-sugar epimerase